MMYIYSRKLSTGLVIQQAFEGRTKATAQGCQYVRLIDTCLQDLAGLITGSGQEGYITDNVGRLQVGQSMLQIAKELARAA